MDNILNITRKLEGYMEISLYNSAFNDTQGAQATIDFQISLDEVYGGYELKFHGVNKLQLDYEGSVPKGDDEEFGPVSETITNFDDWTIDTDFSKAEIRGMRLDSIIVDVIKKSLTLEFNQGE